MRDSRYYADAEPIKSYDLTLYVYRKRKAPKQIKTNNNILTKFFKRK